MTLRQQLESGISHHQAGRLAEAEKIYRQVLALQPNHADALHLLGMLAAQAGRLDAGIELIRRAIAICPTRAIYYCNLGNGLFHLGRLDESIAAQRQATALDPDNAKVHTNLGNTLKAKGQLDEAIASYRRAIRLKPDLTEAHHNLGNALKDKGQLDEATAAYRQAIRIEPDSALAHNSLGIVLQDTGQLDEAIAAFSKAIERRPGWATPRLNLGWAYYEQNRFEEARLAFQKAVECEPNNSDAHNFLATALAELRRFDEAAKALDRAAALAPDSAITHQARGMILWRSGRVAEAVDSFRRAVEIAPESASGWINLGQTLRHMGRFAEVADCVRQVLVRRPGAVQAYTLMAGVGATADTAEMARLTAFLDDPQISIGDRAELGFVLGKTLDDAGRFDEAFAHYAQGNSLVLQMLHTAGARYSSDQAARRLDESIAMFTPDFFARTRDWGEPSELPVFIVGMPRSGTSLVEQIASSHPDVFGAGELMDIGNIAASLGLTRCESGPIKDAAGKQLDRLRVLGGSALRVIDKMPVNVEFLGLIATLFPSARVILCRRDPRDTCLSCFFQRFSAGNLFSFDLTQCGRHHVHTDRFAAHWLKVLPLRMLQVQYEDVVADLEGQSRRIISFLGLPWNPACLDFHRTERTVKTASAWQVRQPIYTRSVGRWRNYERHLGPLFESLGLKK
ncbi:MAG: tetratricopeptide repeat protein [Tepidisphaeraceae bacterium]|jgi:tetratricopeptide (TPR) repeat protein